MMGVHGSVRRSCTSSKRVCIILLSCTLYVYQLHLVVVYIIHTYPYVRHVSVSVFLVYLSESMFLVYFYFTYMYLYVLHVRWWATHRDFWPYLREQFTDEQQETIYALNYSPAFYA